MNMIEQAFAEEVVPVGDIATSAEIDKLSAAMVAIQADMPILGRDVFVDAGASGNWVYTPLEVICEAYFPIATRHGVWTQWIPARHGDMVGCSLRLTHTSGQWFQSPPFLMSVQYGWDKYTNSLRKTPRSEASCLSYCKRYVLCAVVGIVTTGQDDDGDSASGEKSRITHPTPAPDSAGPCPQCGKALRLRSGSKGEFLGCSGYPACKYTRNLDAPPLPETPPPATPASTPATDEPARKKFREAIKKSGNAAGMDDTALSVWIKGMGHDTRTCELDTLQGCINLLPEVSRQWKNWQALADDKDVVSLITPDKHFLQLSAEEREKALEAARELVSEGVPY